MQEFLHADTMKQRQSEHPINPLILNRWSSRAFSEQAVPDAILSSIFEAARWAPSASNEQPWRYIVAKTKEERALFHGFTAPSNVEWCRTAPVLTLLISRTVNSEGVENRTHSFDAGASWGYLALEATRHGLIVHAMAGFDVDKARMTLGIPQEYDLHAIIAVGYRGDAALLSQKNQERERLSDRRALNEMLVSFVTGTETN